jgi:hypothetical protein
LGGGGMGCYLYSPEDLLNKNVSYTSIIIKSVLKMTFLIKTSETKKFVKPSRTYFIFTKRLFKFPSRED